MTSHVALMAIFAAFVSIIFATLMRDAPVEQARLAAKMFGAFVVGGVLAGWLLYPLPF